MKLLLLLSIFLNSKEIACRPFSSDAAERLLLTSAVLVSHWTASLNDILPSKSLPIAVNLLCAWVSVLRLYLFRSKSQGRRCGQAESQPLSQSQQKKFHLPIPQQPKPPSLPQHSALERSGWFSTIKDSTKNNV